MASRMRLPWQLMNFDQQKQVSNIRYIFYSLKYPFHTPSCVTGWNGKYEGCTVARLVFLRLQLFQICPKHGLRMVQNHETPSSPVNTNRIL